MITGQLRKRKFTYVKSLLAQPLGFCRQPTFRNPLCWLNVGHQMIADQHDRALEVIFSRIRENKEILGNLKIEGTTAR